MKRGRWKHSIFLLFRRQCDDFFRCVDDKTERRFTQKRLFCGCSFLCVALDKDTQKTIKLLELCFHFRCWGKKNGEQKIHIHKSTTKIYASELHVSMTLFDGIFFFTSFPYAFAFFYIEFCDREGKKQWNWPGKGCSDREFWTQSYEFAWCKTINHPNNLQIFSWCIFLLFSTGSTMQVANYPDYDMGRGKKI